MYRNFIVAVALAAATGGSLWAQALRTPEVQFKAAEQKEKGDGDLKGAIKEYEKVVSGKDPALAAQALLRIADIHRRLGNKEADTAYQRLIREFGDQAAAVSVAREGIAALGTRTNPAAGVTERFIPLPTKLSAVTADGSVSADGRYIAFTDQDQAERRTVVVMDVATGRVRAVSPTAVGPSGDFVRNPILSPDGRQVVYTWGTFQGSELRLVSLREPGIPPFRKLWEGRNARAFSWTPDGRSILVTLTLGDGTADISLIAAADAARRSLAQGSPRDAFVSPDGKYIALDRSKAAGQGDVFVLPMGGGAEIAVVEHPADDWPAGWSPDGRSLLFTSNRSGTYGLYALAMTDGRPQGIRPSLIVPNTGQFRSLRVTSGGVLYQARPTPSGTSEIEVAAFDFDTGVAGKATLIGAEKNGANTTPSWSRDGKFLAYASSPPSGRASVMIRSVDTGVTREINPSLSAFRGLSWSPDGHFLLTVAPQGAYRIDVQTGEVSQIVQRDRLVVAAWSPDGTRIYYKRTFGSPRGGAAVIAHDMASGSETEIFYQPQGFGAMLLSPDGRYIAIGTVPALAIPTAGGEPIRLGPIDTSDVVGPMCMWAPDSRSLLVRTRTGLIRLPLEGRPTKLSDFLPPGQPAVHPDGKRIAMVQNSVPASQQNGIWVLENFLPRLGAASSK